eukprot:2673616-Rhodomonas_salina.1
MHDIQDDLRGRFSRGQLQRCCQARTGGADHHSGKPPAASDAEMSGADQSWCFQEAKTAALAYCAANPDTEIMIEHHDEADHDHMHRRHLHKVCEECTEMRCTLAVTIVLHGCMADITQSFCTVSRVPAPMTQPNIA